MKAFFLAVLAPMVAAVALPVPQADAWFPDVFNCRCHNASKDTPVVQPICDRAGGHDQTVAEPVPGFGNYVWCQSTAVKSDQRTNRLLPFFNNAACQKEFGAGFTAQCEKVGYTVCFGEEECD